MDRYSFVICVVYVTFAGSSPSLAAFTSDFATSNECAFCHTSSSTALVDREGRDLSIADDWSSTMMGNAFRDPLFRAKVESEVARNPQLAAAIEDKCLTCHAPMARTQAIRDGAANYSLSDAETNVFASDSVSCTLCHQIQNDGLGHESSFSGNYAINEDRNIFGPYKQVFANPMIHHVNYLPMYGEQVDKPELCATCHTLFTPYVDEEGRIAGEFPEQTPYLEWLNSSYASSDEYQSCQDCHMPKIDEPIKITNRPPWYQVRQSPFWKHHFIGGNRFVLEMMKENRERLGVIPSENQLNLTIKRTEERLRHDSAEILIDKVGWNGNRLQVDVKVVNKTGHKFPTGFPSRSVWIHFVVLDEQNRTVFESGNFTDQGEIVNLDGAYEPHHDIINSPEQTQIYQAIMGDTAGKRTETLIKSASYIKDNRIPPKGFLSSGPMTEYTGIAGKAAGDDDFNISGNQEGSGTDLVSYSIDLNGARSPLTITVQLLYQSSNAVFIENLLQDDTPAISRFKSMYENVSNIPVIVDSSLFHFTGDAT